MGRTGELIIMAKEPTPGLVKTRLAAALGAQKAADFYRALVLQTVARLSKSPNWKTVLAITPDQAVDSPVWPRTVTKVPQGEGDLGTRMRRQFMRTAGPAVLIGSDIPHIYAQDIDAAFQSLTQHRCVLGPAPDGGYWLIGFAQPACALNAFSNVRWSSPNALADTVQNLWLDSLAMMEEKSDIDTIDDYKAWRQSLARENGQS